MTKEQIKQIIDLANQAGAEGVWVLREAESANLLFRLKNGNNNFQHQINGGQVSLSVTMSLELGRADMFVIMRFPQGDDGKPGLEVK
jgi:hypothetical protein